MDRKEVKKTNSKSFPGNRSGFTLSEIVVALAIFSMVIGGLLSFNVQMIKGGLFSQQKNMINRDIRAITTQLNDVAKEANYFVLYDSFETSARNDDEDRLFSNRSGDLVVFVFTAPTTSTFGSQPVSRVVGFFRSAKNLEDVSNVGPVMKFDTVFSSPVDIGDSGTVTLEELIPPFNSPADTFEEIVELSKGLANGKLFYNYEKKSIMVNGQIYHGLSGNRVTDTYNFTISPRG
jgi:prepilin-type N-terminal cleavage/methylation domain-containing protein